MACHLHVLRAKVTFWQVKPLYIVPASFCKLYTELCKKCSIRLSIAPNHPPYSNAIINVAITERSSTIVYRTVLCSVSVCISKSFRETIDLLIFCRPTTIDNKTIKHPVMVRKILNHQILNSSEQLLKSKILNWNVVMEKNMSNITCI